MEELCHIVQLFERGDLMERHKLVSVIVPVYNVKDYLKECVDSLIAQDYPDMEILLIDDGSTDGSGELCDEYARNYAVVRVYHKKNGGLSSARNYGILHAKGEYYCFIDSDDYINRDFISTLFYDISNSSVKIAAVGYLRFYEDGTVEKMVVSNIKECFSNLEAQIHLNQYGYYGVPAWNKLFHKSLFEKIRFPEGKLSEDWFIMYKLIEKSRGIYFNSEIKYFYRQRQGSITKSSKINTDAVVAAYDVLNYYIQKKWKPAIPYAVQSYVMANIGVYNAYLIRGKKNKEGKKYRTNVIDITHKHKMSFDGMSKSRKIQLFLFKYTFGIYDVMFKIFNKNRTSFIKSEEKK